MYKNMLFRKLSTRKKGHVCGYNTFRNVIKNNPRGGAPQHFLSAENASLVRYRAAAEDVYTCKNGIAMQHLSLLVNVHTYVEFRR